MADDDLDQITRDLKSEFALLNKIVEYREMSRDPKGRKQSRKAAKAVTKGAKKSRESLHLSNGRIDQKRLLNPSKKAKSEWVKKVCWRCKSEFSICSDWLRPPSLCRSCTQYINETHLPSAPDRSATKGWVQVVSGGAPGLGKRS